MRIKAYKTECCQQLLEPEKVLGVLCEPDIFSKEQKEFKTVAPNLAPVHYCIDCYNANVINPVQSLVNRKKHPELYEEKIKEYSYNFKKTLYSKNIQRIMKNNEPENLDDCPF